MSVFPRRGSDLYHQLGANVYGGGTLDADEGVVGLAYNVDDLREFLPSRSTRLAGTLTPPIAVGRRSVLEVLGVQGGVWVDFLRARATFGAFDLFLRAPGVTIITHDQVQAFTSEFLDEDAIANARIIGDWGLVLQEGTTTAPSLSSGIGFSMGPGDELFGCPWWVPPAYRLTIQAQATNTALAFDLGVTLTPIIGG